MLKIFDRDLSQDDSRVLCYLDWQSLVFTLHVFTFWILTTHLLHTSAGETNLYQSYKRNLKKKKKKHAPHLARTKKFFLILQKHMSVCMFTLEESRTPIEVQSKCQLNVKCSKEIHDAADTAVQPPLLRANRTTNCVVWFSMKQHHCRLCHCWITLGSHYPTCPAFHSSEISCPTSCWLKLVRPCTNMCIS